MMLVDLLPKEGYKWQYQEKLPGNQLVNDSCPGKLHLSVWAEKLHQKDKEPKFVGRPILASVLQEPALIFFDQLPMT